MKYKKILHSFLAASFLAASMLDSIANADTNDKKVADSAVQVIVTANRGEIKDPLDVPQTVVTMDGNKMADKGSVDLDDSLREIPNFNMAPADGNPNYWQEGFSIRGLGAQRVLTLTDGVRQAGQGIGYGGGNLSLYNLDEIERVEVLKGPASVQYGTDAFGGVVNVITKQPKRRKEFGQNGGIRYGWDTGREFNRVGTYLDAGDETFGSLTTFSYSHAGRPNLPDGEEPNSGSYRSVGFSNKTDLYIDETSKIRFLGSLDRTQDILVDDTVLPLPLATFPPPGSTAMTFNPLRFQIPLYQRSLVGAEYQDKNDGAEFEYFQTGIYWQQLRRDFERSTPFYNMGYPGFAGPPFFYNPGAAVYQSEVNTSDIVNTVESQTVARFNLDQHVVTVGLDLAHDNTDLPETETLIATGRAGIGRITPVTLSTTDRVRADAKQYRAGIFAQDEIDLNPVTLTPGVRFDYFDVTDNKSGFDDNLAGFSGSLGTNYRATEKQSVYANLGTGFRSPDLGERFQTGIVNLGAPTQVIGKADLDPERAWSAELGTKRRDGIMTYDIAAFGTSVDDYIGRRSLGQQGQFVTEQYLNVGTVEFYGGEGQVTATIAPNLDAYFNAGRTWTDSRDKVDTADWIFNYGTRYTVPVNSGNITQVGTQLNFRSVLRSEQETSVAGRQQFDEPGFTVADLRFDVGLNLHEDLKSKLVFGVKNLFDRNYKEPFFSIAQPERSIFGSLQVNF